MTNREVRETFFARCSEYEEGQRLAGRRVTQTDIRTMWCEYIDMLCKDGQITEEQAQNLTL